MKKANMVASADHPRVAFCLPAAPLQTVDEMYALPKRSKEYDSLQSAIDSAMYGLSYSAPVSGEKPADGADGRSGRRRRGGIYRLLRRETLPTLCRC